MADVERIMREWKIEPPELEKAADFLKRKAPEWKTTPLLLILFCRKFHMGFREAYNYVKQKKEIDDAEGSEGATVREELPGGDEAGDRPAGERSEGDAGSEGA